MKRAIRGLRAVVALFPLVAGSSALAQIPRPEHPAPDAIRPHWLNLNGPWQFRFDSKDEGKAAHWEKPGATGFDTTIVVPFPWESELSGVKRPDYHGVAWYRREFSVPAEFPKSQRVWLRFSAADWKADVWVNGTHVTHHEGGYSPFEADITDALILNSSGRKPAVLTVRVFDPTDPSLPTGKQVGWYTTTSGIWQTVWLESRPKTRIKSWKLKSQLEPAIATFSVTLADVSPGKYGFSIRHTDPNSSRAEVTSSFEVAPDNLSKDRSYTLEFVYPIAHAKLWTPETPHLYNVTLELNAPDGTRDPVQTYFGLRTIARGKYGDSPYERILLNGKPVYLRTALDQSFNPKGIYTAPDDDFLKRDSMLAKENGLNGLRIHIKPDEPRRLYWADKLGLLILEDMPNTWRQNPKARAAWESTMREVVARDRNHPSIVAWVAFNETWGLVTGSSERYKTDVDTQQWVGRMVSEIRKLDPTRLVEDNSPCNYDHVENTDLNSWHFYIDDHNGAKRHIDDVVARTDAGSTFNYCPGQKQGTAPLINSEYGGVSAGGGDRDISWCFRDLTTLLRHQPKIQGYVYTELTDVEWEHNGFANYDRSPKEFGYGAFVPDMRPNELNGADFVGYGGPPVIVAAPGEKVSVPVFVSHFSDRTATPRIRWSVSGWSDDGKSLRVVERSTRRVTWTAYDVVDLEPVVFQAPNRRFVGALSLTLEDENRRRIAANFVNLVVKPKTAPATIRRRGDREVVLRFDPGDLARSHWSGPSESRMEKACGEGKGWLEYHLKVPPTVASAKPKSFSLRLEVGSRAGKAKVDWPTRPNPQDYPQTDSKTWPSVLEVSFNGTPIARKRIHDDPADARGVLSHLTKRDPGSYGQLIDLAGDLPPVTQADLAQGKPLVIRLAVPESAEHAGGLSLYGSDAGQFPLGPTMTLRTEAALPADLGVSPSDRVTVDRQADRVVRLVASGDMDRPSTWSYTTSEPEAGWQMPGFNASNWASGTAGFGTEGTPAVRVGTRWESERIRLRTSVEMPKLAPDDALVLHLFHDEDVDVFINGKRLLRNRGYITSYLDVTFDPAQKALFRPGSNVVAVSCRQTGGGQGVDLGLTLQQAEGSGQK